MRCSYRSFCSGMNTKDAGGYRVTPAMGAGIERRVWTHRDVAALLD